MYTQSRVYICMHVPSHLRRTDINSREVSSCFDAAFQGFVETGDIRRASRACMRAVEAYTYNGSPSSSPFVADASAVLLRASEKESGVRGALLLEQAAYMFLYIKPVPLVRKYAFHLGMVRYETRVQ